MQAAQCCRLAGPRAAAASRSDPRRRGLSAMLPRAHRLTRGADISHVIRKGRAIRLPHATIHLWITTPETPVRAAFVVGKAVGNSVIRSTVSRRLRHGFAPLIPALPAGSQVVVRAFSGSDALPAPEWTRALSRALVDDVRAEVSAAAAGSASVSSLPALGDGQPPAAPASDVSQ